jgi:S1-C subfamily serine protease
MNGNVIGLVTQFMSASGGSNGVGLALPSNTVETVIAR